MTEQEKKAAKKAAFEAGRKKILDSWDLTGFDSWPAAVEEEIRELEYSLGLGGHVRKEDGRLH